MKKSNYTEIPRIPNKPLRFMLYASKPNAWWALAAILSVTSAAGLSATRPYIFGSVIDAATTVTNGDYSQVFFWIVALILVILFAELSWRSGGFTGMQWITRSYAYAYKKMFEYFSLHSHSYFSNRFAGAITNKISRAVDWVGRFGGDFLWNYYSTALSFIVGAAFLFSANALVGSIFLGLFVFLVILNYFLTKYRRPFVVAHAAEISKLRGQAVDVSSNIPAVQQFARRSHELDRLSAQVDRERQADVKQWYLGELSFVINGLIIVAAMSAMFLIMFQLLRDGSVTLGTFTMVLTLMFSMIHSLTFVGNTLNSFIRTYGDVEDGLGDVLVPHDLVDHPDAKELVVTNGTLEFNNVEFAYGTEDKKVVFDDLSFSIPAGQKVGIVGASGAGKTTLLSILLRQYDLNGGEVLIDDQNIADVTQDSLRGSISVIPQEPLLFHRTIRDNIRYGDLDATDEEVEWAAKMAQAHEFILDAPDGYDTLVGERGIKLSGGQRQRIAIARAMLKKAKILVLDEATSALDSESEILIQKALRELIEGKTVLAIAHRLSTLREMDRILVFDKGQIVQDGTHEELLEDKNGVYARLWSHQAGGFLQDE